MLTRVIARLLLVQLMFQTVTVNAQVSSRVLNQIDRQRAPRPVPKRFSQMSPCEQNFINLLEGRLPAAYADNTALNLWDEYFNVDDMIRFIETLTTEQRLNYLRELKDLVSNNDIYSRNLTAVFNLSLQDNLITPTQARSILGEDTFENFQFVWSRTNSRFSVVRITDEEKIQFVSDLFSDQNLTALVKTEYTRILTSSNISVDDLRRGLPPGQVFSSDPSDIRLFEEYIRFIEDMPSHKIRNGLAHIDQIYLPLRTGLNLRQFTPSVARRFQIFRSEIHDFEQRRLEELLQTLKLEERTRLSSQIDEMSEALRRGEEVSPMQRRRLVREFDNIDSSSNIMRRAVFQVREEARILKRIRRSCSSGNSPAVKDAARKFSRFKLALTYTTTPMFYYMKNKDKLGEDPYWFERLGYEMAMGIIFTVVTNKIITNAATSFWGKYFQSYMVNTALDLPTTFGYDKLFGASAAIRYFQQLYNPEKPQSQVDQEIEALINSPDQQAAVQELLAYLEEQDQQANTKEFFERFINMSAYDQLSDEDRLTLEDIESDEARAILEELVAESLYLQHMGNWSFFQSGNHGVDRWLFYRARDTVWDIKSLVVNLAVFQIMCSEPFGKVGSWISVVGIIMADKLLTGNLTYEWRREAINQ